MKSANTYGSPSSAAHTALCADDPSSETSGALETELSKPFPEILQQLVHLLPEIVGRRLPPIPLQRERHLRTGPWSAADPQVDAARKQRAQHRKVFRDLERAVMRQHHAAAAHSDPRRGRRHRSDHDFRAVAREARRPVMFREPIPAVS